MKAFYLVSTIQHLYNILVLYTIEPKVKESAEHKTIVVER
jgi:hypothetical protein